LTSASPSQPAFRSWTQLGARLREAIGNPSDRLLLTALFLSIFCLDYLPRAFSTSGSFPVAEFIGFVAIAVVLRRFGAETLLMRWDFRAIAAASVAVIHPWRHMGGLALTGLGLLFCARRDNRLASLGQLSLALACVDIWGQMALAAIEAKLLPIETALAYLPLSYLDSFTLHGNTISHPDGHSVIVEGGCSAFSNLVIAALLWLSFMKIRNLQFRSRHFGVLAAGLLAIVIVNAVRIDLCAWSPDYFQFWHEGPGVGILSWIMLILSLVIFYLGLAGDGEQAAE
jgi:exosortase/archaeosortase family protein